MEGPAATISGGSDETRECNSVRSNIQWMLQKPSIMCVWWESNVMDPMMIGFVDGMVHLKKNMKHHT
jgi:hypothetical protein